MYSLPQCHSPWIKANVIGCLIPIIITLTLTTTMMSRTAGHPGRSKNPTSSMSSMATPLVHENCSDLCMAHVVGANLSAHIVTAWQQGRIKLNHLLNTHERIPQTRQSPSPLPYDIVEMIIAHVTSDLRALKAFSLTCRSWYIIAVPHLHHTLTLREDARYPARDKLEPLSKLSKLSLASLIKEIQVNQSADRYAWFVPREFSRCDLRNFSAFTNVHTLRLRNFDIFRFIPHINRYFGHLSPTLRSVTLYGPRCTPQQLSHFLSLFPNLDDIELRNPLMFDVGTTKHVPFSTPAPGLRGRLALYNFSQVEAWTQIIASCGGLQFHHIDLYKAVCSTPVLLEACAETLETIRFNTADGTYGKLFRAGLWIQADHEQNPTPSHSLNSICRGSKSSDP